MIKLNMLVLHPFIMLRWPDSQGTRIVVGLLTWPPRPPICHDGLRLLHPIDRRPLYGDTREEIGATPQYEAIELRARSKLSWGLATLASQIHLLLLCHSGG